jgi:hypothetical protein
VIASWIAGLSFAALVVLVVAGVGVAELRPDGPGTRRMRRGLTVASVAATVFLLAGLTLRVLSELA